MFDISLGLVTTSSFAGESTTLDLIILINLSPSSLIKYYVNRESYLEEQEETVHAAINSYSLNHIINAILFPIIHTKHIAQGLQIQYRP